MYALKVGEKRNVRAQILRQSGTGAINLTSPEYCILDSAKVAVSGFDWQAAQWDSTENILSALFDSTVAALSTAGNYYMQLRGTIDAEVYKIQMLIKLSSF